MNHPSLISLIRRRFKLDWHGIHGAAHWSRVRHIGLKLAQHSGAKAPVVELFAFLHDACRRSDGADPQHGARAALFAEQINPRALHLDDGDLARLVEGCIGHGDGGSHSDPTIATCWDADRLDLVRLGITPDPARLCTRHAASPAFYGWATAFSAHNSGRPPTFARHSASWPSAATSWRPTSGSAVCFLPSCERPSAARCAGWHCAKPKKPGACRRCEGRVSF